MSSALEMIAAERERQVVAEGFGPKHDDTHVHGELADAAACYAAEPDVGAVAGDWRYTCLWPFRDHWKPSPDNRIRELVKAGALIVAEIERLQRRSES